MAFEIMSSFPFKEKECQPFMHYFFPEDEFQAFIDHVFEEIWRLQYERCALLLWWGYDEQDTYCASCYKEQEWNCLYDYCLNCLSSVFSQLFLSRFDSDRDSFSLLLQYLNFQECYQIEKVNVHYSSIEELIMLDDILSSVHNNFFGRRKFMKLLCSMGFLE